MRKFHEFEGHPLGFEQAQRLRLWRATFQYAQDGDTITVLLDPGHYLLAQINVRIAGIDTHEIVGEHKAAGLEARDLLRSVLEAEPYLALRSYMRPREQGESYSGERLVHDVWYWISSGDWVNVLELFRLRIDLLKTPLDHVAAFPEWSSGDV